MSDRVIESELLVELSTEEQQLLSGGQQVNLPIRLYGTARTNYGQIPVTATVSPSYGGGGYGGGGYGGGGYGSGGYGGRDDRGNY